MGAAIARARGERKAEVDGIRRALDEARAQQAPWLELIVLSDLCASGAASPRDRRALATLIDSMPEASDTDAVAEARALLAK